MARPGSTELDNTTWRRLPIGVEILIWDEQHLVGEPALPVGGEVLAPAHAPGGSQG